MCSGRHFSRLWWSVGYRYHITIHLLQQCLRSTRDANTRPAFSNMSVNAVRLLTLSGRPSRCLSIRQWLLGDRLGGVRPRVWAPHTVLQYVATESKPPNTILINALGHHVRLSSMCLDQVTCPAQISAHPRSRPPSVTDVALAKTPTSSPPR